MEKKLYWLLESNGDLSVTVENIEQAKDIIEVDFASENENGEFVIDDLQYTITPKMLTHEEYQALGEWNG